MRHAVVIVTMAAVPACSGGEPDVAATDPSATAAAVSTAPSSTPSSPATAVPTTVLQSAAGSDHADPIRVPDGAAPVVDGVLAPDEWEGAAVFPMSDGAALSMMHRGATLYLAVAGSAVGSVNVLIASTDEVRILHSSAALGSALYERGPGRWELIHGFSWCCRSRTDDATRLALLEEEGWQANIGFVGDPGVVEYQIAVPWQGASVAVSSIRDEDDMGFWPVDLADEARSQLVGVPPEVRDYTIGLWPVVMPVGD